jgi:hypothetical protein
MKHSFSLKNIKKSKLSPTIVLTIGFMLPLTETRAETTKEYSYAADYASGCALGFGAGLVGAGMASTKLEAGGQISPTGYAVSGLLGCLTSMAIVGVIGSQAEFNTAWKYDQDITNLSFELKRANKERCLLTGRCSPGGNGIIVETEDGSKKIGDKIIQSTTFTLEVNE